MFTDLHKKEDNGGGEVPKTDTQSTTETQKTTKRFMWVKKIPLNLPRPIDQDRSRRLGGADTQKKNPNPPNKEEETSPTQNTQPDTPGRHPLTPQISPVPDHSCLVTRVFGTSIKR